VISVGTHVAGFDARSWHRLTTLVAPGLASRAPHQFDARAGEPGGSLVVLYRDTRILRALHTHRGVVDASTWAGPSELGTLSQTHGARIAVAAEAGALEELYERLGGRLRSHDDAATTLLTCLAAARELIDEGALHIWPRLFAERIPLPTPAVLGRAFDFVLPRDKACVVVLFDGDVLDTAVLVHRDGSAIDHVYGPEVLREITGPLGGDFHRDHRVVRGAIERHVAPLSFGLYSETATLAALLRSTTPGAWAAALAVRDVVLDPMPAWAAVAAGAGVFRAAAHSSGLLQKLGALSGVSPTFRRI
jgi:hypothetical protein